MFELFEIKKTAATRRLFENILKEKKINTYYFSREGNEVISKDITSLDAGSEEEAISEWGGLSQFSGKATDVVSKYFVDEA